jgi:hypothetical protein
MQVLRQFYFPDGIDEKQKKNFDVTLVVIGFKFILMKVLFFSFPTLLLPK